MVLFKCGNCGKMFSVDDEIVAQTSFGTACPNCGIPAPQEVAYFANSLVNMETHPNANHWEFFRLPPQTKVQLNMTLQSE